MPEQTIGNLSLSWLVKFIRQQIQNQALQLTSLEVDDLFVRGKAVLAGVTSLAKKGSTRLLGDVTLSAGNGVALTQSGQDIKIAVSALGNPTLVYRYTVTGSDKASIDTGVDTADAGSNDWTDGDVLEIFLYARTDEAVTRSDIDVTFNNDAGTTKYQTQYMRVAGTTLAGLNFGATPGWEPQCPGASFTASWFGSIEIKIPDYSGTSNFKSGLFMASMVDGGINSAQLSGGFNYNDAAAITRMAITPHTAAKKFKVGSQLLIYKRKAS